MQQKTTKFLQLASWYHNLINLENDAKDLIDELKKISAKHDSQYLQKSYGECVAQATLAMRHLEDARARYWNLIDILNVLEENFPQHQIASPMTPQEPVSSWKVFTNVPEAHYCACEDDDCHLQHK